VDGSWVALIPPKSFDADVALPGSKSVANRALICAALADGMSRIRGFARADDSKLLILALRELGFSIEPAAPSDLVVAGGTVTAAEASLQFGNAGTSFRFAAAVAALGRGVYTLDGDPRLRERPMGGLVAALRTLGAKIDYGGAEGFAPIRIAASGLGGGRAEVDASASSQFLSALLLASPAARSPVELVPVGPVSSGGYVDLTRRVMEAFGVRASGLRVEPGRYRAADFTVEPDAASAGYWAAIAAVTGGRAFVRGVRPDGGQPEAAFLDDLRRMGARVEARPEGTLVEGGPLKGIDADLNGRPDSVPALAVTALFAEGPTRIRNVAHLRHKESDRLAALAHELGKLGARVAEHRDGLEIEPPSEVNRAEIETHRDHRLAMAFAIAGARVEGILIRDPECVSKSYPGFWQALAHAGVELRWS
jgi:3-phosphoshikimate 1-carboxyvinyltransferase